MTEPRNPALLDFVENFAMPPVNQASMRHKSGIRRSCFYPVTAPHVSMLKLHNHYLKPNEFSGSVEEYWFIRNAAGLLDVTGEEVIEITGPDALALMDSLVPRDLTRLPNGKAMYCVMCYETGGIVEDAILVRFTDERLWWVGGPGFSENWIFLNAGQYDVTIASHNDYLHVASLQGPKSREILASVSDFDAAALSVFGVGEGKLCGLPATVTRTGYTAELGYDIYVNVDVGAEIFGGLFDAVRRSGGGLCGSESLNLRRMDAAILNFSIDFDWQHTPFEVGLGWMVNRQKTRFYTGRAALMAAADETPTRRLVGLGVDGPPPPPGTRLSVEDRDVGELTSAVVSPSMSRTIALGWVPSELSKPGTELIASIDGDRITTRVEKTPFLDPERALMRA